MTDKNSLTSLSDDRIRNKFTVSHEVYYASIFCISLLSAEFIFQCFHIQALAWAANFQNSAKTTSDFREKKKGST